MIYDPSGKLGRSVNTVNIADESDRNRFSINDEEVRELAKQAPTIERHYQRPMDIEWAKDGDTGKARHRSGAPETVKSRARRTNWNGFASTKIKVLVRGAVLASLVLGPVKIINDISQMDMIGQAMYWSPK